MRQRGYTAPIVALTAYAMTEDFQKCLAAGCNDYATKPIDRQRLLATVAPWADHGQTPDAARGRVFRNSFFAESVLPIVQGD